MNAMDRPGIGLDSLPIGFRRDSEEFRTSSHRFAQFAAAVDDENPRHRAGEIGSPVFAHVPVMQSMVEVLNRAASGFVLHGEHDFIFHRAMVPGQRLFSVSELIGARGIKAGLTFVIRSETRTHDGQPVTTQFSTCLVRGPAGSDSRGEVVPERPEVERLEPVRATYALAPDQTRRYADAARDYSPYTIDPEAAAKAGYPAPLVHGMLTLAVAARSIVDGVCGGDTARLKRLGCRFAHPLLLTPDQRLTVSHWMSGEGLAGFEAADSAGDLVIRNGYAEVRP